MLTRAGQVALKLGRRLTPQEVRLAEQYGPVRFGVVQQRTAAIQKPQLRPCYVGALPQAKIEQPYTPEELYVPCLDDPEPTSGVASFEWGVAIPEVVSNHV